MKTRTDLLKTGSRHLAKYAVINPQSEAETLLCHTLNCRRAELYLDNLPVEEKSHAAFWHLLTTRASGSPLQYLLGSTEFMGLTFMVGPQVFIPRPETEILVETVLTLSPTTYHLPPTIMDIGTGCGNIAISIAKYLKKANIFACDISDFALQLAKENAYFNKVDIFLVRSNLFSAFKKQSSFALIVSNPPYIRAQEIPELPRELHYEPRLALDGGEDGLFFYRRIINQAAAYLQEQGLLALEIGDNQAPLVKELLTQNSRFSLIEVVKDYNDVERVIIAQKING